MSPRRHYKDSPLKHPHLMSPIIHIEVVNTSLLIPYGLVPMRVMMAQQAFVSFSQLQIPPGVVPWIVSAIVAGYDTAVFGLPNSTNSTAPILMHLSTHPNVLVSSTRLSNVVHGRHAPVSTFSSLWSAIFDFVNPGCGLRLPSFSSTVAPAYRPQELLPLEARYLTVSAVLAHLSEGSKLLFSPLVGTDPSLIAAHCTVIYQGQPGPVAVQPDLT